VCNVHLQPYWYGTDKERQDRTKRKEDERNGNINVRAVTGEIWTQKRDTRDRLERGEGGKTRRYEKGGREERE
jgi:hypothetical protein